MAYVVTGQCLVKDICDKCLGPELCPTEALQSHENVSYVDTTMCIECGICEVACPYGMLRTTSPIYAAGRWKKEVPRYADYVIALNNGLVQRLGAAT
jgi:Fe-S-cluster-containing hydrogenase component 2